MSDLAELERRITAALARIGAGLDALSVAGAEVREAEAMRFQDALNRVTKRLLPTVDRLYSSEDQLEGARAFAEKRDPVWKGK